MQKIFSLLLGVTAAVVMPCSLASGSSLAELNPFPAAKSGTSQFVIVLPAKKRGEEDLFRVELIPGKRMMTDGVNRVRLATTIEPRLLQGWGYTYYEVAGKDLTMSTMIAVPDGKNPVEEFVAGPSLLIDYNSRLPIVIYAPAEYEIRYRFWQTTALTEVAEKRITSQDKPQ